MKIYFNRLFYAGLITILSLGFFVNKSIGQSITGPTSVCKGVIYTYSSGAPANTTCQYVNWAVTGGTFVDYLDANQVNWTDNGTMRVKWNSSGGKVSVGGWNCTNSNNETVQVYYELSITDYKDVTLSLNPATTQTINAGTSISLQASGADNYSWSCNKPNCGISSPSGYYTTVSPSENTLYTVMGSKGICSASKSITVNIAPPVIGNTICCDQSYCGTTTPTALGQKSGVTLSGGVTPYTYQWQKYDYATGNWLNITGATSATYQPTSLSKTAQFLRLTNGYVSNTTTIRIVPNNITTPIAVEDRRNIIDNPPEHIFKAVQTININSGSFGGPFAKATLIAGNSITISTNTTLQNSTLKIESCSNGWRQANVEEEYISGIEESTKSMLSPNPASTSLNVSLADYEGALLKIYNDKGSVVKEYSLSQAMSQLDIADLSSGMYMVTIAQRNNDYKKEKLVIIK